MMHIDNHIRELQVYDLMDYASMGSQSHQSTVCLVASDFLNEAVNLTGLVESAAKIGCLFFITWGDAADLLHDKLDEVIERKGGRYLQIVTMSHKDESVDDVAWFLVNAACPGEAVLRCCLVVNKPLAELNQLLEKVKEEVLRASKPKNKP